MVAALLAKYIARRRSQERLDMENLKDLVRTFYTDCLTVNRHADAGKIMTKLLADDFQSINAAESKGKEQLIGQVQFFWKLIPDLKGEGQEMFEVDNHV